jgi:hypothetical protein
MSKLDDVEESLVEECDESVMKKKNKRKNKEKDPVQSEDNVKDKIKKKKNKEVCTEVEVEVETQKKKKKKEKQEVAPVEEVSNTKIQENLTQSDNLKGFNAIYSTNVIQISSQVAQKLSNMCIENFTNSNLGNIVGYGMTEDIEIKVVETKAGENMYNTDKYSIYNVDRQPKTRINPRKILTKIKKTKKSIQVI